MISVLRGLAREVLSLAGWIIAFLAASALSGTVAEWFVPLVPDASVRALTAFVAVFIVALILAGLAAVAVSRLLKSAGLGLEDRLLGGFFGFARGMLIVVLIVLLGGLTALPRQPAWNDAMLSPPLEALAGALKPWVAQAVARYISYD